MMDVDQTAKKALDKLIHDIFGQRLIENSFRGFWCEYLVAEALGEACKVVSQGWHAWDLQIGRDTDVFPERIRIQVKNTAALQTWHQFTGGRTNCQWTLSMRPKPFYFDQYNKNVPCEPFGHLCDAYVLCHHPIEDENLADHRNTDQWLFYIVPVVPDRTIFPVREPRSAQKSGPSYTVVPKSLEKGIRGRPPIQPLKFNQISEEALRLALGL